MTDVDMSTPQRRWSTSTVVAVALYLSPLLAIVIGCIAYGTLLPGGCHTYEVLLTNPVTNVEHGCTAVHLLDDYPSLLLGVSATTAMMLNIVLRRRVRTLDQDLLESGLINVELQESIGEARGLEKFFARFLQSVWQNIVVLLGVLGVGVVFYVWALQQGYLFHALADAAGSTSVDDLKMHWWADWHHYPVQAVLWILVGSAGLFVSMRSFALNLRLTATVRRYKETVTFNHVPAWSPAASPWLALLRLVDLKIIGAGVFLSAYLALMYLARSPVVGSTVNLLLVTLGLLVVAASAYQIITTRSDVRAMHLKATSSRIDWLREKIKQARASQSPQDQLVAFGFVLELDHVFRFSALPEQSLTRAVSRFVLAAGWTVAFASGAYQMIHP